jgi:hypothetical protein
MNKTKLTAALLALACGAAAYGQEFLGSKFDTKNHPKAKGVWLTVRYPSEWQAKEGERPNIVQNFTGYYGDLFVVLSLQIIDAMAPVEQECMDTSAVQYGELVSSRAAKITKIKKGMHENKPAYFHDVEGSMERAGALMTIRQRGMTVCYKNTLVTAWCTPSKFDPTTKSITSTQRELDSASILCFQYFNSLVLMDEY